MLSIKLIEFIRRTIHKIEINIFNVLFKSIPSIDSKFKNIFSFKEVFMLSALNGSGIIALIDYLINKKCKKIILGCTELPIAIFAFKSFNKIKTSKLFLDPNLILANAAMKKYKKK